MRAHVARAIVIVALLATTAPAAVAGRVVATLDGRAIPLDEAGALACHDFEYPIIRCFDSMASLETDVAIQVAHQQVSRTGPASVTSGYVAVFQHALYAGDAKIITTNVAWLSDIGWNDKISSFKSYGASGEFYEHSPSGGLVFSFGPTTQVATLSSVYNDKFSSIYFN